MRNLIGRFKNSNGGEVKTMKKLIMIAAVLAVTFAFLPKAEAADSAQLGLSVTFALEPLAVWTEPAGPFTVQELEALEFKVIAEDKDSLNVVLQAELLPKGAEFIMSPYQPISSPRREGTFKWTPKIGDGGDQNDPNSHVLHLAVFKATNHEGEEVKLDVQISVNRAPVISIELTPTMWVLKGVKLGEKRNGIFGIKNTGTVPVLTDIGYGVQTQEYPSVKPGLEQGKDTFTTEVIIPVPNIPPPKQLIRVIPPDRRMKLMAIGVSKAEPLDLIYGAPTALSAGIKDHGAKYDIRAYADIIVNPGK
jgi:hypothetical protein